MARLPVPGADDSTWGDILNNFLLQSHNADGSLNTGAIQGSGGITSINTKTPVNGALALATKDLADVSVSSVSDGQVLTYDAATSKWEGRTAASVSDATATSKGVIQLAGDLAGTAASPTVPGLATKINTSLIGAASGVAALDATTHIPSAQLPQTAFNRTYPYSVTGTLQAATGTHRLYNDSGSAWTIQSIRASVGGAPVGASVIVDVLKNGTTVFTTQSNRPAIASGSNTSGKVTSMDITNVNDGDYITINVSQVGSTSAGTDLTVQVEVR